MTPALLWALLDHPGLTRTDFASLKACLVVGAPLSQPLRERFERFSDAQLIEVYALPGAGIVSCRRSGGRGKSGFACTIGADVTVGHLALIHACTLEDGSFVGMKACVMDGAVVETGGMVAAGALLTPGKRVRKGELWAGSPAKLMRALSPAEIEMFKWTVEHYVERAHSYRATLAR